MKCRERPTRIARTSTSAQKFAKPSSKRVYLSDYVEKGIPFYRSKEISELKRGGTPDNVLFISQSAYDDFKSRFGSPQINDILITVVGTLGNVLRVRDDSPFYFKDGNLIWLRKITESSCFLEVLLDFKARDVEKTAIGSSQKALTIVSLNKLSKGSIFEKAKTLRDRVEYVDAEGKKSTVELIDQID